MEKVLRITLLGSLLLLGSLAARAQENAYALPRTGITVQVEVRQEIFFAGPYAAYAHRFLNMDALQEDAVTTQVVRASLLPRTEADPSAWYVCEGDGSALLTLSSQGLVSLGGVKTQPEGLEWRFPPIPSADYTRSGLTAPQKEETRTEYEVVQTDTADVLVPIEQKILVDKTLAEKAEEAADFILHVRQERLNIASGNTDASYAGDALRAALQELDRAEQEYLALFRGYTRVRTFRTSYEVMPVPGVLRYQVFRLTEEGPTEDGVKGIPYYLDLVPEPVPEEDPVDRSKRGKGPVVRYRIPAVCQVRLTEDGRPLLQTRIPVYQLGRESILTWTK